MPLSELFRKLEGKEGSAVVDEGLSSISNSAFIDYTAYNENGDLVIYADFPRNETPELIARFLKENADELLKNPPSDMNLEEVIRIVEDLRDRANHIPGLRR